MGAVRRGVPKHKSYDIRDSSGIKERDGLLAGGKCKINYGIGKIMKILSDKQNVRPLIPSPEQLQVLE